MSAPARPYLSNGQVLQRCLPDPKTSPNSRSNKKHPSPPLSARLRTLADHSYNTLGLYVSSLFSVRYAQSLLGINTYREADTLLA